VEEDRWFTSFTFWQRAIRIVLLTLFIWYVRLDQSLFIVFRDAWRFLIDHLALTDQFFLAVNTLLECLFLFLLCYGVFIFWLAQFILPVTNWRERFPATWRLFLHSISGGRLHGAAIFVRDGQMDDVSIFELEKNWPGVAFVDLRSAITIDKHLNRKGAITSAGLERPQKVHFDEKTKTYVSDIRVTGPGLVFTERNEKITGAADLRNQTRSRKGVQADTRDGIRIRTDISCTFTLGQPPDVLDVCLGGGNGSEVFVIEWDTSLPLSHKRIKSLSKELDREDEDEIYKFVIRHPDAYRVTADVHNSGYPYTLDKLRIEQAVYFATSVPDPRASSDLSFRKWFDLPQDVAAQKFRLLLSQQLYLKLYSLEDPNAFLLKDLKKELARQVRNTGILAYRVIALREGGSLEAERLYATSDLVYYPPRNLTRLAVLRDRGIKVLSAGFGELEPIDKSVRKHLMNSWRSTKQKEADLKVADYNLEIARVKSQARVRAQQNMIYHLTQILEKQEYPREALAMLVYQELEAAAANPETRKLLPEDTLSLLTGIGTMLLPGDKNTTQPGIGRLPLVPPGQDNP
jgi:hypothetical protein